MYSPVFVLFIINYVQSCMLLCILYILYTQHPAMLYNTVLLIHMCNYCLLSIKITIVYHNQWHGQTATNHVVYLMLLSCTARLGSQFNCNILSSFWGKIAIELGWREKKNPIAKLHYITLSCNIECFPLHFCPVNCLKSTDKFIYWLSNPVRLFRYFDRRARGSAFVCYFFPRSFNKG